MKYEYHGVKHRCDCCGEEHDGNYCPLCGQKATLGPVTWHSVWAGVMEIWGLHSRSLTYTAWQLLARPGHLMRDYVIGKRQVSFPPVKMLVILGVIVFLIGHWIDPQQYNHEMQKVVSNDTFSYIKYAFNWLKVHEEWFTLFVFSILILPTWLVFRHAPLLPRHTLPQGFFIQTFIAIQVMIIELILIPCHLIPSAKVIYSSVQVVLMLIYLFVDYKQLFGYSWWGTIWRLIVIVLMIAFAVVIIGAMVSAFSINRREPLEILGIIQAVMLTILLLYLIIHFINTINTRAWRTKGKWAIFKWPLIAIVGLIVFSVLGFIIIS